MRPLLVLDLDDTLYPESQYVLSGFAAVDRWLEAHLGISGFEEGATAAFANGVRGNTFDLVLDELHVPATPTLVSTMVDVYRCHVPQITLYDDAAWCLDHFSASHDLGLLTDGHLMSQRAKVRALGIEPLFAAIVYSDELGREHWKPSPLPYRELMRRTGRDGRTCNYVSDNPLKDFVTANALGWTTIRVRRAGGLYSTIDGESSHCAHAEITTLHDLPGVLGSRPLVRQHESQKARFESSP